MPLPTLSSVAPQPRAEDVVQPPSKKSVGAQKQTDLKPLPKKSHGTKKTDDAAEVIPRKSPLTGAAEIVDLQSRKSFGTKAPIQGTVKDPLGTEFDLAKLKKSLRTTKTDKLALTGRAGVVDQQPRKSSAAKTPIEGTVKDPLGAANDLAKPENAVRDPAVRMQSKSVSHPKIAMINSTKLSLLAVIRNYLDHGAFRQAG